MSKYTAISTAGTHTVAQASDYSTNTSTNRRGIDTLKVSKLFVTNWDTAAASAKIYLDGNQITRTINQPTGGGTSNKFIFDQENVVGSGDLIQIGDEVYDSNGITLHGTVTHLNPDGDNTKEIQISATVSYTENETLYIQKPDFYITGDTTIPPGVTFILDDPFSFNLITHSLKVKNTTSGTARLTVRIE